MSYRTDRVDAGVFRLKEPIPELEECFLALRDVAVRDWRAPKGGYLLFGYPASKARLDVPRRHFTASAFRYHGANVVRSRYAAADLHPETHIALDFDIRRCGSKYGIGQAPSPVGVSGGGIWWTPVLADKRSVGEAKLVAILTDYQRSRRLLVGTRLNYRLELIRAAWPELDLHLPARFD
jgi:hypothetical protein